MQKFLDSSEYTAWWCWSGNLKYLCTPVAFSNNKALEEAYHAANLGTTKPKAILKITIEEGCNSVEIV